MSREVEGRLDQLSRLLGRYGKLSLEETMLRAETAEDALTALQGERDQLAARVKELEGR